MNSFAPEVARHISGLISYKDESGAQCGIESFTLSDFGGARSLRALCVLDDVGLVRDVTMAMRSDWSPVDGFCRLTRNGVEEAVLWFEVGHDQVRVEGKIGSEALPSQTIATNGRLAYLGLHPLQGDALIAQQRGTEKVGEYVAIEALTNSISPNGDEAVGVRPLQIDVAYIGEAEVEVPAGRFAARHYRLRWQREWPPADLWVRREDCVFLRMTWAQVTTYYELESLGEGLPG